MVKEDVKVVTGIQITLDTALRQIEQDAKQVASLDPELTIDWRDQRLIRRPRYLPAGWRGSRRLRRRPNNSF